MRSPILVVLEVHVPTSSSRLAPSATGMELASTGRSTLLHIQAACVAAIGILASHLL